MFGHFADEDERHARFLKKTGSTQLMKSWRQDRYNIIFVAVPRTASTSISSFNAGHGRISGRNHASLSQYKEVLSQEDFERRFKFGFVRNPWDRPLSLYFNRQARHKLNSFEEFVHHHVAASDCCSNPTYHHYQLDWFRCKQTGEILADFIGKFENIKQDFKHCINTINPSLKNVKLPYLNPPAGGKKGRGKVGPLRKHYREYYTKETQKIIHERFLEDIEYFNYEF